MEIIKKIFGLLTTKERRKSYFLLILILIMAFLETLGVASILPFMSILTNPELLETNKLLIYLYEIANNFGINNTNDFILSLGALTFFLLIISLLVKGITTYVQLRFTLMREYTIGKRLIEGYLHQPYSWFLNKNSANLGKSILSEVNLVIYGSIIPIMTLIAQSAVALAILTLILIVDPILALRVGLVLIACYAIIFLFLKNYISRIGAERLKDNDKRFSIISEAFGAIKEVKFGGLEETYRNRFIMPAKNYAKNLALVQIVGQLPRYFLEGVAFGGMVVIVTFLVASGKNFSNIIPVLALYAFAGYRLIPALQQIYASLTQLNFSKPALYSLSSDLNSLKISKEINKKSLLTLKNKIVLNNICYKYPNNQKLALENINLTIPAFNKIGIVGTTGGGKTTLVDIILGLLTPYNGNISVDENIITSQNIRGWQNLIGYVPQNIFLADDTVASNIAFGTDPEKINFSSIERAAKISNLHDFIINDLPDGYSTIIGERGIRLSGGQRQRIGIARSLYYNPKILILDEATSSLDNVTEKMITNAINSLQNKITIIIVAHRLSTIKNCDNIYLLENGTIKAQGDYENLVERSPEFKRLNLISS